MFNAQFEGDLVSDGASGTTAEVKIALYLRLRGEKFQQMIHAVILRVS